MKVKRRSIIIFGLDLIQLYALKSFSRAMFGTSPLYYSASTVDRREYATEVQAKEGKDDGEPVMYVLD